MKRPTVKKAINKIQPSERGVILFMIAVFGLASILLMGVIAKNKIFTPEERVVIKYLPAPQSESAEESEPEPVAEPDPEPIVEPKPETKLAENPNPELTVEPDPVPTEETEPEPAPEPEPELAAKPEPRPEPNIKNNTKRTESVSSAPIEEESAHDEPQLSATEQRKLGNQYYWGRGKLQNYVEASKWYKKAADRGDAEAQYQLAWMYYFGEGFGKNIAEARKLYRKSAVQGYPKAQAKLGSLLHRQQDNISAVVWFTIAKHNGASPFDSIGFSERNAKRALSTEQINTAQALAQKCLDSNYKDCP